MDGKGPAPLWGMGSPPLLAQGHRVSGRETPGAWFPVVGEVLSSHLDAVPGFGPPSLEREGCGFNGPHLAEAGSSVTLVADPVLEGEDLREGPGPGGFPLHPKLLPREGALAHAFWRVRFDDVFWDKGHQAAAAALGVDGCDVEHIGHHGEHQDIRDGAAGGLW